MTFKSRDDDTSLSRHRSKLYYHRDVIFDYFDLSDIDELACSADVLEYLSDRESFDRRKHVLLEDVWKFFIESEKNLINIQIFYLYYFERYTQSEIAKIMHYSQESICITLRRMRLKIVKYFKQLKEAQTEKE